MDEVFKILPRPLTKPCPACSGRTWVSGDDGARVACSCNRPPNLSPGSAYDRTEFYVDPEPVPISGRETWANHDYWVTLRGTGIPVHWAAPTREEAQTLADERNRRKRYI